MDNFVLIILALALDFCFGEPKWLWSRLPHPVRLFGWAIAWGGHRFNVGRYKRLKGAIWLMVLVFGFWAVGWLLAWVPDFGVFEVLAAAILLGQRSLVQHVLAVAEGLEVSLSDGRRAVSMIVGRDTKVLNPSDVARGAVESAAENFSDGVVAPVFWFLVFGLPGMVVYKLVNTADSMIGHRTEKYEAYGWAAARLDDVMNYIPARLSALLIILATGAARALTVVRQDAGRHRSPNAGWPEAAMAGALNIALSGPRMYGGKPTSDPYVNASGHRDIGPKQIRMSVAVLWQSWAVMLVVILAIWQIVFAVG